MKNFKLYQVKIKSLRQFYMCFQGLEMLGYLELRDYLTLDSYHVVYEGTLQDDETLENLFLKYQGEKPENYKGRSISVSDIVKVDGKYYYCDSFGWEEVTSEISPKKTKMYKDLNINEKINAKSWGCRELSVENSFLYPMLLKAKDFLKDHYTSFIDNHLVSHQEYSSPRVIF